MPPNISNNNRLHVDKPEVINMLTHLLDQVPSPDIKKRRASAQKDQLDSHQLEYDQAAAEDQLALSHVINPSDKRYKKYSQQSYRNHKSGNNQIDEGQFVG